MLTLSKVLDPQWVVLSFRCSTFAAAFALLENRRTVSLKKVKSPSEVYCKECCGGGWCGLLGPRPRGGMCPTPPTLPPLLYSGLVWSVQILSDHVSSTLDLVLGQVYPSLVWSGLEDGKYLQTRSGPHCALAWSAFQSISVLPGLV